MSTTPAIARIGNDSWRIRWRIGNEERSATTSATTATTTHNTPMTGVTIEKPTR
jgi:hypothetical protein